MTVADLPVQKAKNVNTVIDLEAALVTLERLQAGLTQLHGMAVEQDTVDAIPGGRARRGARAEVSREFHYLSDLAGIVHAEVMASFWSYRGKDDPRTALYEQD